MKTADTVAITECLDELLPKDKMILSYDRSFVDDLPTILNENYGIKEISTAKRLPPLRKLLELLQPDPATQIELTQLPALIEAAGVDKSAYVPLASPELMQSYANTFSHWSENKAQNDVQSILTLQRDLGMGQFNDVTKRYPTRRDTNRRSLRGYLTGVTTVSPTFFQRLFRKSFWEIRIALWKARGWIDSTTPSLSVGPRWVTEIAFFREIVGLKSHIGLDLFSDDDGFVSAGDMHKMPFPDKRFQLIFIKNTTDKSYDLRQLVSELLRVIRPGGIIIVDQICGYGDCSPLTRTDIQSSENLLRIFRTRGAVDVLVQLDFDLDKVKTVPGRDRAKRNVRLAVRRKSRRKRIGASQGEDLCLI
jgi:hypothetical protein